MGHPDFRVGKRIFATLGHPRPGWGMVKLTPEQQEWLVRAQPNTFTPVSGAEWFVPLSTGVRNTQLWGRLRWSDDGHPPLLPMELTITTSTSGCTSRTLSGPSRQPTA